MRKEAAAAAEEDSFEVATIPCAGIGIEGELEEEEEEEEEKLGKR